MKLRELLQIQKIVEDRAIPYDVLKFDGKYHSQSKDEVIEILDMTDITKDFYDNKLKEFIQVFFYFLKTKFFNFDFIITVTVYSSY